MRDHPAKSAIAFRRIGVAALLLWGVTGCQTNQTDAGGKGLTLTEWTEIPLHQTDLDLPLRLPVVISKVERKTRDNAHPILRYELSGRGLAHTERISFGWYSNDTKERTLSTETFSKTALSAMESLNPRDIAPQEIVSSGRHVGYWTIAATDRGHCYFGRSGIRTGTTRYDNDRAEHIDTIVTILFCGSSLHHDMFVAALTSLSLVTDREAYHDDLIRAGKALSSPESATRPAAGLPPA